MQSIVLDIKLPFFRHQAALLNLPGSHRSEQASDAADKAKDAAGDATEKAKGMAQDAKSKANEAAS